MFTNFIKATLRTLYREKVYAIINIAGLSLAIACCIILGLYIHSELTYDQHNTKYRQIYRVENEINYNGKILRLAITSQFLAPMLAKDYPEIKAFVRFSRFVHELLFRHGGDSFYWERVYFADDNIFEIFNDDIIYGNPKTALVNPFSAAVSESFAKKYFGDTNPIGQTISADQVTYKITLVFADLPENTHLKYDVLLSYHSIVDSDDISASPDKLWVPTNYTYLLMPKNYDIRDFKKIADSFYKRYMAEYGKARNQTWKCWLQPLASIHFNSDVLSDEPTGNKLYFYGFTAVAIFILLVACINYMNLATARATKRAKEIDIRKILGSGRSRLMLQFMGESLFFSFIALFLGLVLMELALKLTPLNQLMDKSLSLNFSREPLLFVWIFIFSMVFGLMSGAYPALYLSAIKPLSALSSGHQAGKGSILLRRLLVLIQFIVTVTVIICTLIMALQMRYIAHKNLGFDKENRMIVRLQGEDLIEKIPTIEKELLKNSNILGVSTTSNMLGQRMFFTPVKIENNDGAMEDTSLRFMQVGAGYTEVMGMKLIAGRDFSKRLITDVGTSYLVNQDMVKKMGWKEPLGKHIRMGQNNGRVIGVVKDFNMYSLHRSIVPFAMQQAIPGKSRSSLQRFLVMQISGKEISQTLNFIRERFAEFDPKHPFEIESLADSLNKLYLSEQHLMKLVSIFSAVCIFISCLGLFGLAAFTTEQRTKEIGIRKVLGASTWGIIAMLSNRILLLVLGGAVIASLIAWYAMEEWLTGFAYQYKHRSSGIFGVCGCCCRSGVCYNCIAVL